MKYIAILDSENEFTEEVIKDLKDTAFLGDNPRYAFVIDNIQERKVGKWIFTKTIFDKHGCTVECPSCHKKWKTYDEIRWEKENKFCPNCGTKMVGAENG